MTSYPDFDELPFLGKLDVRHARDVLAPDKGTVAFIGPDQVRAATATVSAGVSYGLSEPFETFSQPLFDRPVLRHEIVETGRNEVEDVFSDYNPQSYSQLDGLPHVRAREYGFFGGGDIATAQETSGVHHWARAGIVGRGVLLDIHGDRLARTGTDDPSLGEPITPDELDYVAHRQGTELHEGDILLLRTGWLEHYRSRPPSEKVSAWNGMHGGEETARYLWNRRIALVGADNPAVECAPGSREAGSLHRRLLPSLGMSLLELLRLDELSEACRTHGRWEFLLTIAPLPVHGAVSSPASTIAVL